MFGTVEIPIWAFLLIVLFATVTLASHFLFPSVRWFFRRRAERIVARLNERLDRPIQPFKLLRRQDMIQRVIFDPEVVRAVGDYAKEESVREDVAFEKAHDYAREIVPSFSATAYFSIAIRLSRLVANWLFDVKLTQVDEEALSAIDPDATVVYVMNHRSNFDYVLVTYLAASQSALSYAVGEWARIWPLSRLIRAMGAYFIRRRSRNALYRKVLGSYVQKATEAGVAQAVFPEGGLSRNGAVGDPKLGILSYIVQGWRDESHNIVFVPVSLNYDRVVEDRVLVAAGRSGQREFRGTIPEGIRFSFRYLWRRIRGRVDKFGVAAVTFGRPIHLSKVAASSEDDLVGDLANVLQNRIKEGVPIVAAPIVLLAISESEVALSRDAIKTRTQEIRSQIGTTPADLSQATADDAALDRILTILCLRGILEVSEGMYRVKDADLAEFYANSLRHHLSATAS